MGVKPFSRGGYSPIHNAVFDDIMPRLSANGWKVLCVAIRQTLGWVATPGGDPRIRKEWDRISYSQFMKKSGIKSRATVSRALKECRAAGFLLRHQVGVERGKPAFAYSLNQDYELPTGSNFELYQSLTGSKNEPSLVQVLNQQKKKEHNDDNRNPHAETLACIIRTYEAEIGEVTPGVKDRLGNLVEQYPDGRRWGIAFDGVIGSGVRRLDYLTTCLENVGKPHYARPGR